MFGEDPQFFKYLIVTRENIEIAKNWLKIWLYCSTEEENRLS